MKKVVDYCLVIVSFVIVFVFYMSFDLENRLWEKEQRQSVSKEQIEKDRTKDYTGVNPGEDSLIISTKEEWKKVLNDIDYVSVIPKNSIKTDVYSLAKWVGHYTKRANNTASRKLQDVKKTSLDFSANYTPYYVIELEDGNHILAQMNRGIAKKIEKGEKIKLPLGKKIGISKKAKNLLKPISEKWNVDTDYVLYTIDNEWQASHADRIFIEKMAISIILFFVVAVILELIYNKLILNGKAKDQSV